MPPNRNISGDACVAVLVKHFSFQVLRQRGSHIVLRNGSRVTVVPRHKTLAIGTLKNILKLGRIDEETFFQHV